MFQNSFLIKRRCKSFGRKPKVRELPITTSWTNIVLGFEHSTQGDNC